MVGRPGLAVAVGAAQLQAHAALPRHQHTTQRHASLAAAAGAAQGQTQRRQPRTGLGLRVSLIVGIARAIPPAVAGIHLPATQARAVSHERLALPRGEVWLPNPLA